MDVRDYVFSCPVCQRGKVDTRRSAGTLHPLEYPRRKWKDISVDFIVGLPSTENKCDTVMTVTDRDTKMVHLVAMRATDGAPEVATHFMREIWRLHGVPTSIVSDRDGRFISTFWQELMKLLGTKLRMSLAFHPQTDGQSEKANDVVETTLRLYTDFEGRHWDRQLATVEFTINNTVNASTGYTPFYLQQGYHPHALADLLSEVSYEGKETVREWTQRLADDFQSASQAIDYAQKRMKEAYDKNKQEVVFEPRDKVLLSVGKKRQVMLTLPGQVGNRKLRAKYVGPYDVLERVSTVAYRLRLPRHLRLHPVFHVDRLKPWRTAQRVRREDEGETRAVNSQGTEFKVEALLKTRQVKRGRGTIRKYLVKWAGYPLHEATWEPERNLRYDRLKRAFWAQ